MADRTSPRGSPAACPSSAAQFYQPALLPGQAAEMSLEVLLHLHREVFDASNVLGNVQEDRDIQLNHLQVLMDAVISLQHPLEARQDLPLLGQFWLTRKQPPGCPSSWRCPRCWPAGDGSGSTLPQSSFHSSPRNRRSPPPEYPPLSSSPPISFLQ